MSTHRVCITASLSDNLTDYKLLSTHNSYSLGVKHLALL